MNRLFIIGNGFDLCNGLKTSYGDFVRNYMFEVMKRFDSRKFDEKDLIKFSLTEESRTWNDGITLLHLFQSLKEDEVMDIIKSIQTDINYSRHINVNFKPFFKRIYNKLSAGWVDIEQEYFNYLRILFDKRDFKAIDKLNEEFEFLKGKLKEYLKIQQDKYYKSISFNIEELAIDEGNTNYLFNNVCVLNFNYTKPVFNEKKSISPIGKFGDDVLEINIHGTLDDEIIFGYGDEEHASFDEMLENGNDNLLKNFKLQIYPNTERYSLLNEYLNKDKFEVYILGHSCGLSDRSILKHIFEHTNCDYIRLYVHHKSDKEDNYQTLYNSISRILSTPQKTRDIVSIKPRSKNIDCIRKIGKSLEIVSVN